MVSETVIDYTCNNFLTTKSEIDMVAIIRRCAGVFLSVMLLALIAGKAGAVAPQAGWWWNPAEGGRGFTLEVQNGTMFMAGYLYDPSGRATWYAAGPTAMNGSTFSAPLLTYLGGQTLTSSYRPTTGTINNGTISMTFTDASHGALTWPGGTVTVPIQRYDIVPGGAGAARPAGTPETGWWWNTAEGGRGYSIEIQNGTMFMAGYMYDDNGNPIWYASGPKAMTSATTYQDTWQQYGNGQTMTGAYKQAAVLNANVKNIGLTFNTPTTATLTMPNMASIQLTRYSFGGSAAPPAQSFAGVYAGSYDGADTGTFNVTISATGVITGTVHSNGFGVDVAVTGTTGAGGAISMTTSGSAGTAAFSGTVNAATGAVSGSWSYIGAPASGGSFSGQRQ